MLPSLLLSCIDNISLGNQNNLRIRGKQIAALLRGCLYRQLRKQEIQL